ncbi:hypothetical protein FB390_3688 [Nocardia bhagyanarayanae]|uniref:Uncharacterized protein n=1 Tax=Nocardia bhagyanarayanae TaxID=1215925 RepID=A0A543FDS3_9NOCA|nr:hypothetical protein FB390_3688 [Nocardia bhagyanarayanae]
MIRAERGAQPGRCFHFRSARDCASALDVVDNRAGGRQYKGERNDQS